MRSINKELLEVILEEIKDNPKVTELYLANKYLITERTVRRYIRMLKNRNIIMLEGTGNGKKWFIVK